MLPIIRHGGGKLDSRVNAGGMRAVGGARRGRAREWLAARGLVPAATPTKGFGKSKPVAPNTTDDGRDDPEGRQKNRRVEVVFDTCT